MQNDAVRVLCAGDRFISADLLAAAVRELLPHAVCTTTDSDWPHTPFRAVDGVREAAGDVADLVGLIADVDVLVTHLAPVTAEVLAAASHLSVVGSVRGGPVNIDIAAATARHVPVSYLPGRNLNAVAEFVVGSVIAGTRNIGAGSRQLASGTWDGSWFAFERTGTELGASTVGLVGFGAIGARVAELLRAFGSRVLAYDPFTDPAAVAAAGAEAVSLPDLLSGSDVVSVHARLTDETRGMFDEAAFEAMKPGVFFVNTARGELVDYAALRHALDSGQVGGAALDVFDPEPPAADDPMLARLNVAATPHLAGGSRQVAVQSAAKVAAAVAGYLETGDLANCANPETLTRA